MSYSNNLVKRLSSRRIQLAKRLSQAEGKLKFASRYSYRKIIFKMMHNAVRAILSLKIKLNKLNTEIFELECFITQWEIAEAQKQIKLKLVNQFNQSTEEVKKPITDDCQVAVFEFHADKDLPNTEPQIKSISESVIELTSLQFKALEHCYCYTRQWHTKAMITIYALCCNNPNYFEPQVQSKVYSTKPLANDGWLQSLMAIPVPTTLKGTYYQLYFNESKVCLGGTSWEQQHQEYAANYCTSNHIWLPENYNPVGKHFDELKAIPKPLLPASTLKKSDIELKNEFKLMDEFKDNSGDLVSKLSLSWCPEVLLTKEWDITKQRETKDLTSRDAMYVHLSSLMENGHFIPLSGGIYTLSCKLSNRKYNGRGKPRKTSIQNSCTTTEDALLKTVKKSIPKTHQTWTGTVKYVDLVDGKSFDPKKNNDDRFVFKRLKVELKLDCGRTIQFWTPNTEIRIARVSGCAKVYSDIDVDDWIKSKPALENYSAGWSDMPVSAFKAGDLITVSGKIKSTWRDITVINWVRLQELVPQSNPATAKITAPKLKNKITPYEGKQLSLLLV